MPSAIRCLDCSAEFGTTANLAAHESRDHHMTPTAARKDVERRFGSASTKGRR